MMVRSGVLTVLAAVLLTTGCSGGGSTPATQTTAPVATTQATTPAATTPEAEPKTEAAARALAEEEANRYASGDWGGAWDLWTEADKQVVTREDYIRLHETCTESGMPLKVESVRLEGDKAIARIEVLGYRASYSLLYEGGQWRWQIDRKDLKEYQDLGVDGMIAARKKDGSCSTS